MAHATPDPKWVEKMTRAGIELTPSIECPTCKRSGAVFKVPRASKVLSALALGLLGNARRQQFKCGFCSYAW